MTAFAQSKEIPGCEEYRALRAACGLSPKSHAAAELGLPNSLFATTIQDGKRLIAMGRVVGDGGLNFEVVDIAVHLGYQRQGLGRQVMDAVMAFIHEVAPESACVDLIADHHSPALYSKYGFESVTPKSIGMALTIK